MDSRFSRQAISLRVSIATRDEWLTILVELQKLSNQPTTIAAIGGIVDGSRSEGREASRSRVGG